MKKYVRLLPRYMVLVLAMIFILFPVYWMVTMAFKNPNQYYHSPPIWWPAEFNLVHFQRIISSGNIRVLGNSLIITLGGMLFAMLLGLPAAYSLARFKTGGDNFAFLILSQRFIPPIAFIVPIFMLFRFLKFVDTFHGLILLYAAFNLPFVIWMMRGYFRDVPIEIEESALVDGCTPLRVFWSISLPLSAAGIISTGIFTFIFIWNEFLFGLVLARNNVRTLPVQLTSYFGPQSSFWGEAAALSVIAILPIIFLTLITQRYFARGLTLGAVK